MITIAREVFKETGLKLFEGPYCYFAAPNYESLAEIQMMKELGAITAGASTIPEQTASYLAGMRGLVISCPLAPASGMGTG